MACHFQQLLGARPPRGVLPQETVGVLECAKNRHHSAADHKRFPASPLSAMRKFLLIPSLPLQNCGKTGTEAREVVVVSARAFGFDLDDAMGRWRTLDSCLPAIIIQKDGTRVITRSRR